MTSRRQARNDAMVVLYQHDITGTAVEQLYERLLADAKREPEGYTLDLVRAVLDNRDGIDAVIDRYSRGWPAHRMAALERSILRIAVQEMIADASIPAAVSIDEAVTLAKRYCSREAAALINGILGQMETGDDGEAN